jgi:subtilisin family serine protease
MKNRFSRWTKNHRRVFSSSLTLENLEARHLLAADLGISDPFELDAVTFEEVSQRASEESYVPGEIIVATQVNASRADSNEIVSSLNWSAETGVATAKPIKTLLTYEQNANQSVALVHIDLGEGADVISAMQELDEASHVLWSSPNFVFSGDDPRDLVPNDAQFGSQYHHPLIGNVDAWDITLGDSNILIGITDDGVDIQHEDLVSAVWTNPGEVPGDGIDNDGNGYVDDVNGYNFLDDNNNPDALAGDDHGTHVAGISSATINNSIGTVGTAPGTTIVPLKWYDGGAGWTAAVVAETFTYAADNGVDIVNTSYNMDGWANDPVVHAAFDYMYDAGVLHFNSAGNGSALNPPRQVFVESLLTVSTDSSDMKAGSSNYGIGVDISAPGNSVLSTTPNNTYSTFSGTSMAAPNAAGAAALIWSANPSWSREQVVAQLLGTAENIDAVNGSFAGLMGAGRINTFNAMTQTLDAPQIKSFEGLPPDGGILTSNLTGFDVSFDQIMDPAAVNDTASYELRSAGFDGVFDTADDDLIGLTLNDTYKLGSNSFRVDITSGNLGFGEYRLTLLAGGLQNPFATPLDGNADGVGGDNFETFFTVEAPAPVAIAPLGSLIYEQSFPNSIDAVADTDRFGIEIDPGQTLTVLINGAAGLTPTVEVTDPDGVVVANVTATGSDALAQVIAAGDGGEFTITVGGAADSVGGYDVSLLLNAAAETEDLTGLDNDSMATAQNIDSSVVSLNQDADRLAIIGQLPSSDGIPVDGEDFESGAFGPRWATSSSAPQGQIDITGTYGTASGALAMVMAVGTDSTDNLNEAIWTTDLTGINSPTLTFYHAEWSDEETSLPQTFTGSFNGDGVSISDDGVNWHRVFNPTSQADGEWVKQTIDLVSAANVAGITLGANFQVKFQQFDNFTLTTDGRGYDNISINEPTIAADWYEFSLEDGQVATVGATNYDGAGTVDLELFDSAGNLVASGTGSDNVDSIINKFQDTTTDGVATSYFARLSGQDAGYSLLVTRDAEFDTESNDDLSLPQNVEGVAGVLGYASAESMGAVEPDNYAAGTVLNDLTPGVTLSNNLGGNVFAASASFAAPTGSLVLAPGVNSAAGWSEGANEFRADFDQLTSFVSIDVGSDDSSDVAFLRAYSSSGTLLEQVTSGSISSGASQTIAITRNSADIAYVIATGVGSDITPLDNLVFGQPGSDDVYATTAVAGDVLDFAANLPAGGPLLFENELAGATGSNLLMELLDPSGAVVTTDSTTISHTAAMSGEYLLRVSAVDSRGEYFISFGESGTVVDGDFNDDGDYDCDDIDMLVAAIANGSSDLAFDLSSDGALSTVDIDLWLAEAGAINLPSGNAYQYGDANLDGTVNGNDFLVWNQFKFQQTGTWCQGDFNADGETDGNDFLIWNANKFTSARVAPAEILNETAQADQAQPVVINERSQRAQTPLHSRFEVSSFATSDRSRNVEEASEERESKIDLLFATL